MGFNSPPKTLILQWVHACNLCVIYDLSIDWVNTGWGTFVQHVFSLHGDADQTWIALRTSTDLQQAGPLLKKEKHIYGELDR